MNRHRGGAVLLDDPELLHCIVVAVRAAVPVSIPLGAKMRLGVADTGRAIECAQALKARAARALWVVHARTKADGYRPPAHWGVGGAHRRRGERAGVANGEVWCAADWQRCRAVSGVADVMLGRGAVADPFLPAGFVPAASSSPTPTSAHASGRPCCPCLRSFVSA